jgi:hypothetical protein
VNKASLNQWGETTIDGEKCKGEYERATHRSSHWASEQSTIQLQDVLQPVNDVTCLRRSPKRRKQYLEGGSGSGP